MSFIIRPSKKNNILTLSTKAIQYLGMISRRCRENSNMKQPPTSSKRGTVTRGGKFGTVFTCWKCTFYGLGGLPLKKLHVSSNIFTLLRYFTSVGTSWFHAHRTRNPSKGEGTRSKSDFSDHHMQKEHKSVRQPLLIYSNILSRITYHNWKMQKSCMK